MRKAICRLRLMQEDNANELKQIFRVQRVPADEWKPLFRSVFYAVSPKGSAEQRVGQDPLAPEQARALKASLAFQEYRIANVITNLRIKELPQNFANLLLMRSKAFMTNSCHLLRKISHGLIYAISSASSGAS